MGLAAGTLNQRIEIHALTSDQDEDTGAITEDWSLFSEVWANIRPSSVAEFIAAGAEYSKVVVSIRIRHLSGIKRSMRIRHGERLYNIEGVLEDPFSGREYITLPCSEVVE